MGVDEYWRDVQKSPWHDTNFDGNIQVLQKQNQEYFLQSLPNL